MDFIIVIFLIGVVGSFISGMVGIGGSIIKYPMLLYIPVMLGYTAFSSMKCQESVPFKYFSQLLPVFGHTVAAAI